MTCMCARLEAHPDYCPPIAFTSHGGFEVIGCVPRITFWFTVEEVRSLPPEEDWPLATGNADKILAAGVDARFVLSEIIKYAMSENVFGRAFERADPRHAWQLVAKLKQHQRDDPGATWLDRYIAAAHQARNRRAAHRLLGEIDDTP